ncbi:MAG: AMIN domain-containing protein [Bdellovibrionales bacterium]|nr:AMIN domain-containing protein [Bdellovibrionales bacterium]
MLPNIFCRMTILLFLMCALQPFNPMLLAEGLPPSPPKYESSTVTVSGFNGGKAEVFSLTDPPRLVLDLIGDRENKKPHLSVDEMSFVKNVRLGIHPDKIRVVLDLKNDSFPDYEIIRSKGSVSLVFQGGPANTAPVRPIMAASIVSVQRYSHTSTISPEVASNIGDIAQEPASPDPVEADLVSEVPRAIARSTEKSFPKPPLNIDAEGQQLKTIVFGSASDEERSELILELAVRPEFSLNQISPESFNIVLPRAKLAGKHLALPFFPPNRFMGLTMVKASQGEDGVEIELTVEHGSQVRAFARGKKLVVQTTSPLFQPS